jgi:adenylylsulfate kinase-like enzyme
VNKTHNFGLVLWITGLSGAGKTTLAREVVVLLRIQRRGVVWLDGDELRDVFGSASVNIDNHGREGRMKLAMQYAYLCRVIASQGLTVVISTISMFKEVHIWNRLNLTNYYEVYLKVPLSELQRRDPKDIYRRFDIGDLSNVAGLDLKIDEPKASDWVVNFMPGQAIEVLADELLKQLYEKNL